MMRVAPRAVAALLGLALALAVAGLAIGATPSTVTPSAVTPSAVTPSPSASPPSATGEAGAGDTRSSGQGPGFVGDPLLAILGVLAIGGGTAVATLAWVRLTGRRPAEATAPRDDRPPGGG